MTRLQISERLPMQTVVVSSIRQRAGQIAIDAVREAGVDPRKALNVPMIQGAAAEWGSGKMTREEFINVCRNMLVFQPGLAL